MGDFIKIKSGPVPEVEIGVMYGAKRGKTRDSRTSEESFRIMYAENINEAYLKFRLYILENQPTMNGLSIESMNVEESATDPDMYVGRVKYSPWRESTQGTFAEPVETFSTKGGTAKITQSLETVDRKGATANSKIPDFKGGIGYENGVFQGVDRITPNWTSGQSVIVPYEFVDDQYKRLLRSMTGCVNSTPFDGMAPGECMFFGCDGGTKMQDEDKVWELKFDFRSQPNVESLEVPGLLPVAKTGWDYLWVLREEVAQENETVQVPRAVYVERVYNWADFNALGFGF